MPCGVTSNQILPRRYILRAGVTSPLTCRHPKHAGCTCYGEPTAKQAAARTTKAETKAETEAIRQIETRYEKIIAQILYAVRDFPDAAAAVRRFMGSPQRPDAGSGPGSGPNHGHA